MATHATHARPLFGQEVPLNLDPETPDLMVSYMVIHTTALRLGCAFLYFHHASFIMCVSIIGKVLQCDDQVPQHDDGRIDC